MSLKSWKEEFYPLDADRVSEQDAVAHSIRKWEGLRPESINRHGLSRRGCKLLEPALLGVEGDEFQVNQNTCALCQHFNDYGAFDECGQCPLFLVRGGVKCDDDIVNDDGDAVEENPYGCFSDADSGGNPEPMIRWLKAAEQLVQIKNAVIEANKK